MWRSVKVLVAKQVRRLVVVRCNVKVFLCDLGSAQAYCCEGHFEGIFDHGDAKVYADKLVTMAVRR